MSEAKLDYVYEFECEHGDGTIFMMRCGNAPPLTFETPCPFGGGETIFARRKDGGKILTAFGADGKLHRLDKVDEP